MSSRKPLISSAARTARRLALAVVALLAFALVAELVARFLPLPTIDRWMVPDPLLGFRMPAHARMRFEDEAGPGAYALNSLGFRGPELPAAGSAPPGGARVLFIGDSFLHAWGVRDEDWVATVVRETLRAAGVPAETFALCADDFGTAQELLLLREYGARVLPADVVLLLYPGNDVINGSIELAGRTSISAGDYFRPYLVLDQKGELRRRYARPWPARLRNSRLFSWFEARWLSGQEPLEVRARLVGEPPPSREERVLAGELPEEYLELFREPRPGGAWDSAWRTLEALLVAFQDETRRLGARLLGVVVPHSFQVERRIQLEVLDREVQELGGPPLDERLDWDYPEERLEGFFHRAGIAHLQLLQPLRGEVLASGADLYLSNGHLGGRAHAWMGGLIAERLSGSGEDLCFLAGSASAPVAVAAVARRRAVVLDFLEQPRAELFRSGWQDWRASTAQEPGGWPLVSKALLLAPAGEGTVTLRGSLAEGRDDPLHVRVLGEDGGELAHEAFPRPGEFRISFDAPPVENKKLWSPVWLVVADPPSADPPSDGATEELPRLFLTGMRFDP